MFDNPANWTQDPEEAEPLPLSLLNDYLYCPRRAALKLVEGRREANVHTERGDVVHEHSDLAGYEVAHGVKLLRALPVWSERLGLSGKCDIVEVRPGESPLGNRQSAVGNRQSDTLYPVEFKVGPRRRWENDDVQVCAQAICLEEMFGVPVPAGAIFHAESKHRRQVEFTPELRQLTAETAAALHELIGGRGRGVAAPGLTAEGGGPGAGTARPGSPSAALLGLTAEGGGALPQPAGGRRGDLAGVRLPAAVFKPACKQCSLYSICLPELVGAPDAVARAAAALFKT